jgi:hypothetical protein
MTVKIFNHRFGKLVARKPTDERAGNCVVWSFDCDCGVSVRLTPWRARRKKHCGCDDKQRGRKSAKSWRNAEILRLWLAGESGPEIALEMGITRARVYQIIDAERKRVGRA